ncbi:hypothetical protein JOM56_009728 [Amanita muscaria]
MEYTVALRTFVPRTSCTQCRCTGFIYGNIPHARPIPSSANELCACAHPYWQHTLTKKELERAFVQHQAVFRGRQVETGCGGFYPTENIELTLQMLCTCQSRYFEHELLPNTPMAAGIGTDARSPTEAPGTGTDARRISSPLSAIRTTPLFNPFVQPTTSALSSGELRMVSASRHRRSAPGTSARASPRTNASRQVPERGLACAIIPFSPKQKHPSHMFKLDTEQRRQLVHELTNSDLVFNVNTSDISSDDVQVWPQLDVQVKEHLAKNRILLTLSETYGNTYLDLSWMLCKNSGTRYKAEMPEFYDCTLGYLRKIAQRHPMYERLNLFFIAPKEKNLEAHVTLDGMLSGQTHPCWPWRVVSKLSWITIPKDVGREPNECLLDCPQMHTTAGAAPTASTSKRQHSASPPPTVKPVQRRRFSTRRQLTPPPTEHTKNSSPGAIETLDDVDLQAWRSQVQRQGVELLPAYMKGPDAPRLAKNLLSALRNLCQNYPQTQTSRFTPVDGVQSKISGLLPLLCTHPDFHIEGNPDITTTGLGPVREVYDTALSLRITDGTRWAASTTGGYHTIHLCDNPDLEEEDVALEYMVDGLLFALYLITVGVGPDPISPFVLLAASAKDIQDVELPQDYVLGMIPDEATAEGLREVYHFKPNDIIKISEIPNNRIGVLATEHIAVPAIRLSNPRENDAHSKIQKQMLTKLVIGHTNPWTHQHFLAFKDGFNWSSSKEQGKLLQDTTHELLEINEPTYAHRLLAAVYHRRIECAGVILDKIIWVGESHTEVQNARLYDLFIMRVMHWLRGIGHPRELVGKYVDRDTYLNERDAGVRARMLYRAITGSSLILGGAHDKIRIKMRHLPNYAGNALCEAKVCFMTLEVIINTYLRNELLLQPGELKSQGPASRFDLWWHAQLLSLATGFNDA